MVRAFSPCCFGRLVSWGGAPGWYWLRPWRVRGILPWAAAFLSAGSAFAELAVRHLQVGDEAPASRVPEVTAQGRFLAPQAVSAVDIAGDGKVITVGTMAFSHDANVWQFSPEGEVMAKRHFPPWAPMQVATLAGGKAVAVGLAYSRVTSPDPTVWFGRSEDLFAPTLDDEFEEPDSADGQLARMRPGEGDWRRGWFASSLGELFVRGPDWVFKPPQWFLDAEGSRHELRFADKNLLPTNRALRMASSTDGRRLAFAWLGFGNNAPRLSAQANALDLWQIGPNQKLWSAPPTAATPSPLPNSATDFPELAKDFRLAADALVPGHAAAAVAVNRDGSRVAMVEYGIWGWVRNGPAIGKWDPPIHVLNFVPRQRGRLRVFDGSGRELISELLPAEGLFELGFGADGNDLWCWPGSWFARGMAGEAWLPVDRPARTLYRVALSMRTAEELVFPDAIAACAPAPAAEQALVSCWDGSIYLVSGSGAVVAKHAAGAPARLAWKHDGAFAVAGTADGRLIRLEPGGTVSWNRPIEGTEIPPRAWVPREVVPGLPVFQGGRISRAEHAYVGDIWVIRNGGKAVVVDAGGLSGFSETQARLRALDVDQVTHVVQTHSHGDHCGGAYLFRAAGAQIVGPKSAAFTLTWLMPMLTDYGIYPPRPLDVALPLGRVGDEADFEASGLNFHALFVPGHSFDLTIYTTVLAGRLVAFTGDLGFENQDILHRCWSDAAKAREVVRVIRDKLLPWQPDIVFTGHGVRTNGTEFLTTLVRATENSLAGLEPPR
jgi:glyoxylase-like metal-dependent hydrolase (beta-lactamase superfamily II)